MFSLLNTLKNLRISNAGGVAVREYAARKGTRERKLKLKKKRKAEKKVEEPVKKIYGRETNLVHVKQRPFDDSHYPNPVDDVYFHRKFRKQEYSFPDVVQFHREVHHETVYNQPSAPLFIRVDCDLKYPNRVTKCQDPWKSLIEMKAPFQLEGQVPPSIIAFCQENVDQIQSTIDAGAEKAGGIELIKACQEGQVKPSEFDYVICHPLVITELATIRGLIKRQFPAVKTKTIGADLPAVVRALKNGVKIKLEHSNQEPDFGHFTACVGRLNMTTEELEGNFEAYIKDTISKKVTGKDPDAFLLQCHAYTTFSFEKLRINWRPYASLK